MLSVMPSSSSITSIRSALAIFRFSL